MMFIENATAVIAFVLWLVAFALGYVLRRWMDGARDEWTDTFTYRQEANHER